MKNLITFNLLIALLFSFFSIQAQNKKNNLASYYKYEIDCVENLGDGKYVFMTWGKGNSKNDAIEQAQKNLIIELLFKGLNKNQCDVRPIITEVQARNKYRSYTGNLLKKDYKKYVKLLNKNKKRKKSRDQTVYGVEVEVDVESLRLRLINDKIIK